jgi:hypothetical protein
MRGHLAPFFDFHRGKLMKNLVVSSTRTTAIGTFIPGVVYVLDETQKSHSDVIKALVHGKGPDKKPTRAPANGRLLSDAEAEAFRKERGQQAKAVVGVQESDEPKGEGVVATANLKALVDRAEASEALAEDLTAKLSVAEGEREAVQKKADELAEDLAAATKEIEDLKDAAKAKKPSNGDSK